jgi:hypothetical protein
MPHVKDKVFEILAGLKELRDSHSKLDRVLSGGPAPYYFEKIGTYVEGLFSFAKFKPGDRVCLAHDIDCDDKPGWVSSEHFLKAGSTAVVSGYDFGNGAFKYGVVFDLETWLDDKGVAQPVTERHEYWFTESDLRKWR